MKKLILGLVVGTAVVVGGAGPAFADVSTNGTTNDAHGYGIANHIANFNTENGVQLHGIGHLRSEMTGEQISGAAGNRAPAITVDSQGSFAPISNNG